MPKIVDHVERRAEAVEVLLDLIAEEGVAAVSSRTLARRMGMSNGALWRYFRNKDELLTLAYRSIVEETNRRAATALRGRRGLTAVWALVHELLPLEPASQREARVVVGFWGASVVTANVGGAGWQDLTDWEGGLLAMLRQAVDDGELVASAPVELLATLIVSYSVNAQIHYVIRGSEATDSMVPTLEALVGAFRAG